VKPERTTWEIGLDARRTVLLLIAVTLLLRVLFAAALGLGIDESYVAAVSRSLSLSYFDHPPLQFWIVRATALLTGHEDAVVLRLPFILLFAGTTWLMYRLTARCFGESAGAYAAIALNLSAVFSVTSGGWVLPDGPLMFFMLAAATVLASLLFENAAAPRHGQWVLFGLLAGCALLSKYHAVFLLAGLFFFLVTSPRHRHLLATPGPYLACAAAGVVFLPVLVWNAQHAWVSFAFQGGRAASRGFMPVRLLINIAGQAIWVLPWVWVPLVVSLLRAAARGPSSGNQNTVPGRTWFFVCLASGPIVVFTLPTLWGAQGLFHWQAPGYLMAFPLLGLATAQRAATAPRLVRAWLNGSAAVLLLLVVVFGSHAATGWVGKAVPALVAGGDPTLEAFDWTDVERTLRERGLLDPPTGSGLFVVARHWADAGKLDYALGGRVQVITLSRSPHHFAFMHPQAAFLGRDALVIGRTRAMADVVQALAPYFENLQRLEDITLYRRGAPAIVLTVYLGTHFRGEYPLPYGGGRDRP
jgi:4-amino-4-deoxy-L-arabinose transferase-like glycosyltransferase